jgi:hypothetical protein
MLRALTHPSNRRTLTAALALVFVALVPLDGFAQQRRGRAVPRGSVRSGPGRVVVVPSRPNYYRTYRPSVNLGFFYGYPGYYGGYRYGYPAYGYYGPRYYGWAPPYGYGYSGYAGRPYGGVRIDLPQRDAEVYVDGYFVGTVDDFDGRLQQANLETGPHRIEVRHPDFAPITFQVNVEPGRTITYRGDMRPR